MIGKVIFRASDGQTRGRIASRLDQIVSLIVRRRDKVCVQCGSFFELTAGHIFTRGEWNVRWDLENVFCQCWKCNSNHVKDKQPYFDWFINKFGQAKFDELQLKAHKNRFWKTYELKELYKELKLYYEKLGI